MLLPAPLFQATINDAAIGAFSRRSIVLVSWSIAFLEYCFQVPANRIGHARYSAAQLKTIQEVITLVIFAVFSVLYLKEELKWNYIAGFVCILAAVFFVFKKW